MLQITLFLDTFCYNGEYEYISVLSITRAQSRRIHKGAISSYIHSASRRVNIMDVSTNVIKTGTSTVGITYDGGVVVGADHRATMGHFIANKSVQKLFRISENVALTTAGLVGHAQSLSRMLAAELRLYELKRNQQMTVKGAATLTANILSGRPHYVQLLIVGVDSSGASVYSIDSAGGSIPDVYCATGSGSPFMYGVLEDQFKDGMDRDQALALAAKSLLASAQRDAASGNGMDLAYITNDSGFTLLSDDEVSELLANL
jgi:proteasome beta subunit